MLDTVVHDVRYAVRTLLKEPGWTLAAVVTLALAIGATTAIFSFVDGILLQRLPYDDPDALVTLQFRSAGAASTDADADDRLSRHLLTHTNYPNFLTVRQTTADVFEGLAAYDDNWTFTLSYGEGSGRWPAAIVSAGLFSILRAPALLGGTFTEAEDAPGSEGVVVLSHRLWRNNFGADPGVVGSVVKVNDSPHRVVGVMPEGFSFPSPDIAFWIPMADASRGTGSFNYGVVGRLAPGISRERAGVLLRDRTFAQVGWNDVEEQGRVGVLSLHEHFVGDVRPLLLVFLAAVGVVLLIACVNVVNLTLTRAARREKEHVMRAALGAGRARLAQQVLTESLLVSLASGVLGVFLALFLTRGLLLISPESVPRKELVGLDAGAVAFTFAVGALVGIAVGLLPAMRTPGANLAAHLSAASRGASSGTRHNRLRDALVVAQMAMALILLVCAGLLLRSFSALLANESGFDPNNVLTFETALPRSIYPDQQARMAFYDGLLEQLDAQPGVRSTAIAVYLPAADQFHSTGFSVPGYVPAADERPQAEIKQVSPGYFETLGIALLDGRLFTRADDTDGPRPLVINGAMARKYWPGGRAVGSRIDLGETPATVVGIVDDVRYRTGERNRGEVENYQIYVPYAAVTRVGDMDVLVRTAVPPAQLIPAVRRLVVAADPEVALFGVMTMQERLAQRVSEPWFRTLLLGAFGLAALGLAAVGIYGVMAYSVAQRTREVGIRKALGAERGDVVRQVIRRGLALAAAGTVLGLAGAWVATSLLESYLYGLAAHDPLSFAAGLVVLLGAALLACALPALRAARVDPIIALRAE